MRRVKIEGDESGIAKCIKVTDTESGEPIKGIRSMHVTYYPGEPVIADIEIAGIVERSFAEPRFWVVHPVTGERLEVTCIKFADGSIWIPEKDPDVPDKDTPMQRYLDTKPASSER